jgi:branched-chain amino acid transport system substrate-binding protein
LTRPRPARPLALAAALTLALGVTACGADDSRSQGDAVLTVYVSAPLSGPGRAEGQDVADGARMALADAGGEAGGVEVRAEYLDIAGRNESRFDPVTAAANARTASEDSTTIAYVGELDSGASRTSTPILNEAGILQVAPGSGAEDLVRAGAVGDDVPLEVQPTGARTFARLVPSDGQVGGAIAGWIAGDFEADEVTVSAQGEYGQEVLEGFEDEAAVEGLDLRRDGGVFPYSAVVRAQAEIGTLGMLTGQSPIPGRRLVRRLLARMADVPVFFPDAVLAGDSRPERSVFVASAHLDPTQLPAAGQDFAAAFTDEYGRAPNRFAAYGYEAMASILAAVDRADDPLDRASVVGAYFDGTERDSVIGAYSVTDTGETTLGAMTGYELSPSGRLNPVAELNAP